MLRHGDIADKHLIQHFVAEQTQIVYHLHFMTLQNFRTIKSQFYAGRKMIISIRYIGNIAALKKKMSLFYVCS